MISYNILFLMKERKNTFHQFQRAHDNNLNKTLWLVILHFIIVFLHQQIFPLFFFFLQISLHFAPLIQIEWSSNQLMEQNEVLITQSTNLTWLWSSLVYVNPILCLLYPKKMIKTGKLELWIFSIFAKIMYGIYCFKKRYPCFTWHLFLLARLDFSLICVSFSSRGLLLLSDDIRNKII